MEKSNQKSEFLQSALWRKFQESVGRKTHSIENGEFSASIVEHVLPIVGKYMYIPKGPVILNFEFRISNENLNSNDQDAKSFKIQNSKFEIDFSELINLAKKNNAGWVRIEPENEELLNEIKESTKEKILKAPHDMQPKQVLLIDISKSAEQLLTEMKPKTRYNIGVAKKKNVKVISSEKNKYTQDFLRLTKEMADRQGITAHPEEYYRKMIESLPEEMMKIYVAEFEGKIIGANLVLFFEGTATYLHGASSNLHRNVMAPFLLQWQQILDAKEMGCTKYDFGGVRTQDTRYKIQETNKWEGITNFKLGFSPHTKPLEFPGSYDIIVNQRAYMIYRGLQRAKAFAYRFRK